MSKLSSNRAAADAHLITYRERLRTPWWWYLAALAVAVLLGAEFAAAVAGWIAWLPFAIVLPTAVLAVWRMSSGTVTVTDDTVSVGDRTLALSEVTQVIPLTSSELRRLVGRHGDPLAYNFIRSWVGPGVQFVLAPVVDDPADVQPVREHTDYSEYDDYDQYDDTPIRPKREPYWLVSTRHPDRVLAALGAVS